MLPCAHCSHIICPHASLLNADLKRQIRDSQRSVCDDIIAIAYLHSNPKVDSGFSPLQNDSIY